MGDGYAAFRDGCAVWALPGRGLIRVLGEDRARLLHAMCTNHVQQLQPGQGCYAFFLTAQGRILADAHLLCAEDHILLDLEPPVRRTLYEHLDRYIIADDVTLDDASDERGVLAVEGPQAGRVLAGAGLPVPEEPNAHRESGDVWVARVGAATVDGFRLYGAAQEMPGVQERLERAGAMAVSDEDAEVARIERGRPRYGVDILETHLPQETRQMQAVHFSKGCYLGQEIVERVRSRGHVNRLLMSLRLRGEVPVRGIKLVVDGKEVGEVTSAARVPAGDVVALGYVRAEHAKAGVRVRVGEAEGEVA